MNPLVLASAALLTAPALHESLVLGVLPAQTAGVRFAVAVLFLWIGTSLVDSLIKATSAPRKPAQAPAPSTEGPAPMTARPV